MAEGKVLPYLDIPFQHATPDVLEAHEAAGGAGEDARAHPRWREICPDLTLRSTFIVGFPGETDADFEYLLDWLEEAALDRVGCFRYEPVAGAPANDLGDARARRGRRKSAGTASCRRSRQISARRLEAQGRHAASGHRRRGRRPSGRQGPLRWRRAGDRRRGLCREPPAACASARSPRSRSSAPTPTTCTAPRSVLTARVHLIRDRFKNSHIGSAVTPPTTPLKYSEFPC